MSLSLAQHAPVQRVRYPEWERRGVEVSIWRLDCIDTPAPGNKLFKLHENFAAARVAGRNRVLSFGGAFSNHIHALALAGAAQGFATVGIIRGDAAALDNPTLRDAAKAGMELVVTERGLYRDLCRATAMAQLPAEWAQRFGDCHVIPEGGSNRLGVEGCRVLGEAIQALPERPDLVVLPCGTGATLAGLVAGLGGHIPVLGIAVLKGDFVAAAVQQFLGASGCADCTCWSIDADSHCGGYARVPSALQQFLGDFMASTGVPVEPVYSGKMLYAIHRRIARGEFARGTRLLLLHTGGLQGARGFAYRNARPTDNIDISFDAVPVGIPGRGGG